MPVQKTPPQATEKSIKLAPRSPLRRKFDALHACGGVFDRIFHL